MAALNRRAFALALIVIAIAIALPCIAILLCHTMWPEVGKNGPIPNAAILSSGPICYEGPIKVTTLHEINAAEVRTGVNLFDDVNPKNAIERKALIASLRFGNSRIQDQQTKACYTFWLDRAQEGNLTPASIEKIP